MQVSVVHWLLSSQSMFWVHSGAGVGEGVGEGVGAGVGSHKHVSETQCAEQPPPLHSFPSSGSFVQLLPLQESFVHSFSSSQFMTSRMHTVPSQESVVQASPSSQKLSVCKH